MVTAEDASLSDFAHSRWARLFGAEIIDKGVAEGVQPFDRSAGNRPRLQLYNHVESGVQTKQNWFLEWLRVTTGTIGWGLGAGLGMWSTFCVMSANM